MSATRTLIDVARFVPSAQLTTALDSALTRRSDLRGPSAPVVVELLGYRWHRSKEQLTRDAARMNALVLDGFVPMQFTYDHVTVESEWVIEQTRHALHRP